MEPTNELHGAALNLAIRTGKIEANDRDNWPLESARITNSAYVLVGSRENAVRRVELGTVMKDARKMEMNVNREILAPAPDISRQLAAASRASRSSNPAGASLAIAGAVMIVLGFYDLSIRAASETSLIAENINSRGRQNIGLGISLIALSSAFSALQATIRKASENARDSNSDFS